MSASVDTLTETPARVAHAVERACRSVAPSWPLDRQVAVNPYWGLIDQPFTQVASWMRRALGARFGLAPEEYGTAWRSGEITPSALARALAEYGDSAGLDAAVCALERNTARPSPLALLSDILDRDAPASAGPRWGDTITQQVSQYCASYFDEHQSDWHRARGGGLFSGWRATLRGDHTLEPLRPAAGIRARVRDLPDSADAALGWALQRLAVPPAEHAALLQVCLLRINGWASWCAFLGWEASRTERSDPALRELLAIRTSWEALLDDGRRDAGSPWRRWREHWRRGLEAAQTPAERRELAWQRAQEISYQDRLFGQLLGARSRATGARPDARPAAQLVFCIDVRSERLRRALESTEPGIETRGFAGFFGLPIRYQPLGTSAGGARLPVLLAPSLDATDSTGAPEQDEAVAARRARETSRRASRRPFLRSPSGGFSLVETIGLGFAAALLRRHFAASAPARVSHGRTNHASRTLRPRLAPWIPMSVTDQADQVASILRAMSLTAGFARLLVLVGHGSQSENNPQAALLDCGACGGHSGDINARILAGLLNEHPVRQALAERGIVIPQDTVAVGALHNTTTDELELFDLERMPASHADDLRRLERSLLEAGRRTRAERAPQLGLAPLASSAAALLAAMRRRARDWAETRPEWGLANNAAFIVAPRARTRGVDLAGRCFLQDYTWADDRDGRVLEGILTAPMIVTHWINLQYFASTTDPEHFGSGNKLLHNVVCGNVGVFEGNTGDLRIGLSRQSVHDGHRWMHAPLRLSVLIDAPRARIEAVLARHATVRHLVDNEWIHLFRFADAHIEWRRHGRWQDWTPGERLMQCADSPAGTSANQGRGNRHE